MRPVFRSQNFFPVTPWTVNYYDALADPVGGETRLMLTPAQFRSGGADPNRGTLRQFTEMDFRLFYSNNLSAVALSAPPAIAKVTATPDGAGNVRFQVSVSDPVAGVQEVWITLATTNGVAWETWI